MRIAILHREYPPQTVFVSTSLLYQRMAKAFVNKGHEVHVICQSNGKPLDRDDDGVHIHEVGFNVNRGSAQARVSYSYHAWRKLRELRDDIDVVNAEFFLGEGLLYSLSKGDTPLVLQAHAWAEGWMESHGVMGSAKTRMAAYLEKVAARRANRIIATSKSTYQWLLEKAGLPSERLSIVYEFIDTTKYRPVNTNIRERLKIPEESRMVLFVAGMEPRKGPVVLANAIPFVLRQVPETKFVFIGRDTNLAPGGLSMRAHIEHIAEESDVLNNVIFTGMLPVNEVIEAYSACDIFVYPGLLEAGGLPPLEAMACNCPVVATATGVSAELEKVSRTFLVVKPDDPKALADGIVQLLSLPRDTLKELSTGHRAIVEDRFSFDRMVNQILEIYKDALPN